jgi:hypothetical protein
VPAGVARRGRHRPAPRSAGARGGELVLFPDLNDENSYYYVVDKPRLARDANGQPKFSFLRYVENVRGAGGADAPREGDGGGIVHAVVTLSVSRDQIQAAQRDLQRVKPGALVKGPAIFKSGKFGLVTSFKDPQGGLSTQCVGIGNAPILDNQEAAISIQLTKLGAKILWESFNTAAPDISFSFEMELQGYQSPKRAVIEANFDQIYEHKSFNAAVASQFLAAEIKMAFEDLTRTGAIKVTQVGADQQMESLINTAYTKITEIMFSPLNGTGTPSLSSLTGAEGTSLLDRATTMLAKGREEAKAENERRRRAAEAGARTGATQPQPQPQPRPGGGGQAGGDTGELSGAARDAGMTAPRTDPAQAGSLTHDEATRREKEGDKPVQEVEAPKFAVVAAFEMKRIHQRGVFKIDLNKYTPDSLTMRFDENIGDLSAVRSNARFFREVNLDDPLYQQREIAVMVDGLNAQDFGQYINFVTVQMRKKHASGEETLGDVRIDRVNFNKEGNRFGLLYGWKGDKDRRRWLEYEYRPVWSFFGGVPVEGKWTTTTDAALNMAPPYQRRIVELQASTEAVQQHGIRAITVRVFYTLAGVEKSKTVTLNAAKSQLSEKIEFMLPTDSVEYAYDVTWQLTGNRTRSSGRQTASTSVLFVDEVPAQ